MARRRITGLKPILDGRYDKEPPPPKERPKEPEPAADEDAAPGGNPASPRCGSFLHGVARRVEARLATVGHDVERLGRPRRDLARRGKPGWDKAWRDVARNDLASHAGAEARNGEARFGEERQGKRRLGKVRRGQVCLLAVMLVLTPSVALADVNLGDGGSEVREVQSMLHDFGYTVAVDGTFGPQTDKAVRSWQRSNGLEVDGIVGPATLASLRIASRKGNAQQVTPTQPPPQPPHYDTWLRLAQCESRGRWDINTGNGYYGGLQFNLTSWRNVGGTGYPNQASAIEQMWRAERLLDLQGWGAWPSCARQLGLR